MIIRVSTAGDKDAVWSILEPVIRAGESYTLPSDMSREAALIYWFAPGHQVFVAEAEEEIIGTYFLRSNQQGGGAHVANCGYVTASHAIGRGVAYLMCRHSLNEAKEQGYLAMQFNFVISTNQRALALWKKLGFEIVGRLPQAFLHPHLGLVDAFVMYRKL